VRNFCHWLNDKFVFYCTFYSFKNDNKSPLGRFGGSPHDFLAVGAIALDVAPPILLQCFKFYCSCNKFYVLSVIVVAIGI